MRISQFFRCTCGKLHATHGTIWETRCPTCDRKLLDELLASPAAIAEQEHAEPIR
jgi:phage FluMu protein Com